MGILSGAEVCVCLSGETCRAPWSEKVIAVSTNCLSPFPAPVSRGALRFPVRAKKVSRVREFGLVHNCELVGEEQYMRQFLPGRQGSR